MGWNIRGNRDGVDKISNGMKIDGKTKIYGVFGYPVKHTLSPAMHNAGFQKLGLNSIYLAFEVDPKRIKDALRALPALGVRGVNLTIPHKELCLPHIDEVSKEASLIKAVNTIVVKNERLIGYNTDGMGFIKAIREDLGFNPLRKKVFIIGAGGAGRAISMQLAMEGANCIWIYDCVKSKARRLASGIKAHFPDYNIQAIEVDIKKFTFRGFSLLVNATPVGMKKSDPLLIDPSRLHSRIRVYDLVYNTGETRLIRAAKKRGLKAAAGLNMLLYQGAGSFRLWTGRRAPIETMQKAILKELSM